MFRVIQSGNSIPFSWPVDPSAEFQPGQIAQLRTMGNNIVCGVSDGSAPIGIIDDIKTNAFTANSIDEVIIVGPIPGVAGPGGSLVTPFDVKAELERAYVMPSSFVSDPVDVELIPTNGVVRFLAGTELNFDLDGDGIADSIRTVVSYTYRVANVPGDNSTAGSGRVTVWFQRIIFQTDQYDTTQRYPLNAPLFVNEEGKLTTKQPGDNYPVFCLCTGSPGSVSGMLEAIML